MMSTACRLSVASKLTLTYSLQDENVILETKVSNNTIRTIMLAKM